MRVLGSTEDRIRAFEGQHADVTRSVQKDLSSETIIQRNGNGLLRDEREEELTFEVHWF